IAVLSCTAVSTCKITADVPATKLLAGSYAVRAAAATVSLLSCRIAITDALPVLWIVFPPVAADLSPIDVYVVPVEIVVAIDVDIHITVAPVASTPKGAARDDT